MVSGLIQKFFAQREVANLLTLTYSDDSV